MSEYIDEDKKTAKNVEQVKCVSCGAPINFDAETQKLKCPFCSSEFEIDTDKNVEEQLLDLDKDAEKWSEETKVFRCSACGAETVFDKNEFAKICVFCSSPSVTEIEDLEGVRPNAVIPFAVSAEKAKIGFSEWIKRRFFTPSAFKKYAETEEFFSVYCPSWTFDSHTQSNYKGVAGHYYYVRVRRGNKSYMERRIRYRSFSGKHSFFFDDIHINSGRECAYENFEKLKPFPFQNAVVYSGEFLAGHIAEHYSLPLKEGWSFAKDVMNSRLDRDIRASVNADVIKSLNVRTVFSGMTYKYLLLPIYVYTKKFKKKLYKFFINGCTCKIAGKPPLSPLRILFTTLFTIIGLGAISALIYYFGIR